MEQYTIKCNESHLKKAIQLGAKIYGNWDIVAQQWRCDLPTAEQMCGWLRENGVICKAEECYDKDGRLSYVAYCHPIGKEFEESGKEFVVNNVAFTEYKSAILLAIGEGLSYLETNGCNNGTKFFHGAIIPLESASHWWRMHAEDLGISLYQVELFEKAMKGEDK